MGREHGPAAAHQLIPQFGGGLNPNPLAKAIQLGAQLGAQIGAQIDSVGLAPSWGDAAPGGGDGCRWGCWAPARGAHPFPQKCEGPGSGREAQGLQHAGAGAGRGTGQGQLGLDVFAEGGCRRCGGASAPAVAGPRAAVRGCGAGHRLDRYVASRCGSRRSGARGDRAVRSGSGRAPGRQRPPRRRDTSRRGERSATAANRRNQRRWCRRCSCRRWLSFRCRLTPGAAGECPARLARLHGEPQATHAAPGRYLSTDVDNWTSAVLDVAGHFVGSGEHDQLGLWPRPANAAQGSQDQVPSVEYKPDKQHCQSVRDNDSRSQPYLP
jgi:hypothetical protein